MNLKIQNGTALYYLHEIFVEWTLSGDLKQDSAGPRMLLVAFYSLLSLKELGGDRPEKTIHDWIEDAVDVAFQTGLFRTRGECDVLRFDAPKPSRFMTLEMSFSTLWNHTNKNPTYGSVSSGVKAKNLEAIRSALDKLVGTRRQQELIALFDNELRRGNALR